MNNITSDHSIHASHLSRLDRNISSINEALEGAKILFQNLSVEFSSVKEAVSSNNSALESLDQRCTYLELGLSNARRDINDRFSTVQSWIDDLRPQSDAPVPKEIVDSIQEVISDSAPGLAVESMRGEVRELRKTIVTEGLRNLVVGLVEQVESFCNFTS